MEDVSWSDCEMLCVVIFDYYKCSEGLGLQSFFCKLRAGMQLSLGDRCLPIRTESEMFEFTEGLQVLFFCFVVLRSSPQMQFHVWLQAFSS